MRIRIQLLSAITNVLVLTTQSVRPCQNMRHCLYLLSFYLFANLNIHAGPLGKFVVVGDSLTAGFQNFSLYTSETVPGIPPGRQQHGYAPLIAQQAGTDLRNPTVLYPGIPS